MNRRFKHLFYVRLINGLAFLFLGIFHFLHPEDFKNILRVSNLPLLEFNVIFFPLVEVLIGTLLLIGLFTRTASIMGCIATAIGLYTNYCIIHFNPHLFSSGSIQVPYSLPAYILIILFIFCVYLLIMGAGAWSIDYHSRYR